MLKNVLRLAVLALMVNALWQIVPPYWNHVEFKKKVEHLAVIGRDLDPAKLADEVFKVAQEYDLPVERESIEVRREPTRTYIDVVYVQTATPVPGWRVTRPLEVHVDAFRY